MRRTLTRWLWTSLAAIFLIEAWLWDVLGRALAALVAALPIETLRRGLRQTVDRLPAAFALALFVLPVLAILPCKIVGLALLAHGRVLMGGAVFLLAKTVGLGLTAFLFDVCHDRLMTLAGFRALYARVTAVRLWADQTIEPYRRALRIEISRLRVRLADVAALGAPSLAARVATVRARVRARARR